MIYRMIDRLHSIATRREINKISRTLDELTGGDIDQKIAHHVGELMTLTEVDATRAGKVVDSVFITVDEDEGYRCSVQYIGEEVET